MNTLTVVVPKDAPIRQSIHNETLCKKCEKVLDDCSQYQKKHEIKNGSKVILKCSAFIKQI